jgi:hypothetical protein
MINASTLVGTVWKSSGIAIQLTLSALLRHGNNKHRTDVLQTYFLTDHHKQVVIIVMRYIYKIQVIINS